MNCDSNATGKNSERAWKTHDYLLPHELSKKYAFVTAVKTIIDVKLAIKI